MRKICIITTLACAAPLFAQNSAQSGHEAQTASKTSSRKAASKKKAAQARPAASPMTLPKGAVLDPKDGNYHYTDKNGRKWVYMMTPMGPSRWEDKGTGAAVAQPESTNQLSRDPNLKAIDQGDTVKFVRSTPFGDQSWTKKKSELTNDERSMIAAPAATGAQNPDAQNSNAQK